MALPLPHDTLQIPCRTKTDACFLACYIPIIFGNYCPPSARFSCANVLVVLPQDSDHFWSAELGRDLLASRQHLPLARTRDGQMMLRVVAACLARCHAGAAITVERYVNFERLAQKCPLPQLIEDVLGIKRPIVAAHACVIAPDNQM